jgi:hypothetical protein
VEFVVQGEGIRADGGDAEVLGSILQRLGRLIQSLGVGPSIVEHFAFANSAHIRLRSSKKEADRAQRALELAQQVARERSRDDAAVRRLLKEAAPDVQVAATLAADLISVPAHDSPAKAVTYGASVAVAYKSLATAVVRNHVQITLEAPDRPEAVRLTPDKARRVEEALRASESPQRFTITVFGTLEIADAHKMALVSTWSEERRGGRRR